jgi:glycerol-3-phosphate dehydrogenase subunit B
VIPRVIVIGAGVAGLAAAWSARREGREVTLVDGGVGASSMSSGAVDDVAWEPLVRAAERLGAPLAAGRVPADTRAFLHDFELWSVPEAGRPLLATVAGRLRPARGRDGSLLDLEGLDDARVVIPRVHRPGWDADAIATTLTDDPAARARKLWFMALDAEVLRFDEERRIADGDLAARHDDPARLDWLAGRLRASVQQASARALLLGPWLGANAPRADDLAARLGVRAGEALAGTGSAAGLRFDAARKRLLAKLAIEVVRDRAVAVEIDDQVKVTLERDPKPHRAESVVLAIGGLVGGGLVYAPPETGAAADIAERCGASFSLSLEAPVELEGAGVTGVTSSMHGPELDRVAWPVEARPGFLESVGIRCTGTRARERISVAGDARAGRPRTVLEAITSGIEAGRAAS